MTDTQRRPPLADRGRVEEMSELCDAAAADFRAWTAGDASGLDALVRRLTPLLWHVVRAYRLDQAAAEDVVQSTFLALVRRADAISDPQAVVRWLCVTARREAWRTASAGRRVEPVVDDVLTAVSPAQSSPEDTVVRNVRDAALWGAVSRLDERCRRLLRVVAFSPRPDYAALSTSLGMPVGSIGPTRGRCLAKLRAELGSATEWRSL